MNIILFTCLVLIVWTSGFISVFRVREKFKGPLPKTRISRPVLIFSMFLGFILTNFYICYAYVHIYSRIDLCIGIEAYIFISSAIMIFIIFRQRRSQSGRDINETLENSSGYFEISQSQRTNDDKSRSPFYRIAFVVMIIGAIIAFIFGIFCSVPGVIGGTAIIVIGCFIGALGSLKKRE